MIKFSLDNKEFKTEKSLKRITKAIKSINYDDYAKEGLELLKKSTPIDSGKTADSWSYKIIKSKNGVSIDYYNDNVDQNGIPIVIFIQYGHIKRNGGWVEGLDFINPSIRPLFLEIVNKIWNEVERQ